MVERARSWIACLAVACLGAVALAQDDVVDQDVPAEDHAFTYFYKDVYERLVSDDSLEALWLEFFALDGQSVPLQEVRTCPVTAEGQKSYVAGSGSGHDGGGAWPAVGVEPLQDSIPPDLIFVLDDFPDDLPTGLPTGEDTAFWKDVGVVAPESIALILGPGAVEELDHAATTGGAERAMPVERVLHGSLVTLHLLHLLPRDLLVQEVEVVPIESGEGDRAWTGSLVILRLVDAADGPSLRIVLADFDFDTRVLRDVIDAAGQVLDPGAGTVAWNLSWNLVPCADETPGETESGFGEFEAATYDLRLLDVDSYLQEPTPAGKRALVEAVCEMVETGTTCADNGGLQDDPVVQTAVAMAVLHAVTERNMPSELRDLPGTDVAPYAWASAGNGARIVDSTAADTDMEGGAGARAAVFVAPLPWPPAHPDEPCAFPIAVAANGVLAAAYSNEGCVKARGGPFVIDLLLRRPDEGSWSLRFAGTSFAVPEAILCGLDSAPHDGEPSTEPPMDEGSPTDTGSPCNVYRQEGDGPAD